MSLYKIDSELLAFARIQRKSHNPWEYKLWQRLRGRRLYGHRFKRQVVIGPYIVDFSCFEKRLIIELDGGHHAEPDQATKDLVKSEYLKSRGYSLLHFWNNEIETNLEGVLEVVVTKLQENN